MARPERPARPAHRPSRPAPEGTEVLYGLRCGQAVFERRRQDIRRVGYDAALAPELAELLRWASGAGVPCRQEPERELSGPCAAAVSLTWL